MMGYRCCSSRQASLLRRTGAAWRVFLVASRLVCQPGMPRSPTGSAASVCFSGLVGHLPEGLQPIRLRVARLRQLGKQTLPLLLRRLRQRSRRQMCPASRGLSRRRCSFGRSRSFFGLRQIGPARRGHSRQGRPSAGGSSSVAPKSPSQEGLLGGGAGCSAGSSGSTEFASRRTLLVGAAAAGTVCFLFFGCAEPAPPGGMFSVGAAGCSERMSCSALIHPGGRFIRRSSRLGCGRFFAGEPGHP